MRSPAWAARASGVAPPSPLPRPLFPGRHLFHGSLIIFTTNRIFTISPQKNRSLPLDWGDSSIIYLALLHAKCQIFSMKINDTGLLGQ